MGPGKETGKCGRGEGGNSVTQWLSERLALNKNREVRSLYYGASFHLFCPFFFSFPFVFLLFRAVQQVLIVLKRKPFLFVLLNCESDFYFSF